MGTSHRKRRLEKEMLKWRKQHNCMICRKCNELIQYSSHHHYHNHCWRIVRQEQYFRAIEQDDKEFVMNNIIKKQYFLREGD